MNRTIKFRAWEKNLKEMISVEEIDFGRRIINSRTAWRFFGDVVLMEFTGITDKNGTEIYEGDIVKVEYDANVIKLNDGREFVGIGGLFGRIERRFELQEVKKHELGFNNFTKVNKIGSLGNETLEVIGNIFENKLVK